MRAFCGINNLIIYSCNAGYSDWADRNVESAFRGRVNGAPVLASDGTVYSVTDRTKDLPYDSQADENWRVWVTSNRTDNNGWNINQRNIGTKQLTLLQMKEKRYEKNIFICNFNWQVVK
ncbi:hypothetical protein AGMMS50284_7930 [Clostridia bacterium]|nr:hypothetical protein AGMMS50284_7930 [Clostridia bacterium]